MLTWAFEFEGQPYFDGFRTLATNGIDKPVLNLFPHAGHDARPPREGGEQRRRGAGRAFCNRACTARRTWTAWPRAPTAR